MRPSVLLILAAAGCSQPLPSPSPTTEKGGVVAPAPPSASPASPAPTDTGALDPVPTATAHGAAPTAAEDPAPAELDARFVPLLAAAFRDYKAWGRVDDELRWAPWLCRMPLPGRPRMSAAEDGGHARKLYSVLAKDHDRYPRLQGGPRVPQPVGQVVVKESYHPEAVSAADPQVARQGQAQPIEGDHFHPYASDGKALYRASHLAGIYVVLKMPAGTAGTDAGWIYGTVTAEGVVTSAGRVASCMGCHVSASHERLFGLGQDPVSPGLSPLESVP